MFERTKMTSGWVIVAVVVINSLLCMGPIFPGPVRQAITTLAQETGWLISPLLFLCGVDILLLAGGLMILLGRLRLSDLGLTRRGVLPGLVFFLLLWAGVQVVAIAVVAVAYKKQSLHPEWATQPTRAFGAVAGNTLGVGLLEELVFRGFLLPQLCLRFGHLARRRGNALVLGLIGSQVLFALGHIPHHLRSGTPVSEYPAMLALMFAYGVLFSLVYLRSGNLLYAVAVHGLINAPAALVNCDGLETGIIVLLVLCWLVLATCRAWLRPRAAARETTGNIDPRRPTFGRSP